MKNYVLVTHDGNQNRALYYVGLVSGSYYFIDDVNDAKRYDISEVADIIGKNTGLTWLGISIVRIEDCTFEKLKTDKALQKRFTDFLYVTR